MNEYCNPYSRLTTYYHLWQANDNLDPDGTSGPGMPIERIHEITKIPKEVIRRDIVCLFQCQGNVAFDEDSNEYERANRQYNLDDLFSLPEDQFPETLEKLFYNGLLDDIPLLMTDHIAGYQISLTPDEAAALLFSYPKDLYSHLGHGESKNSSLYHNFSNSYQPKYQIKDSYRYYHYYDYHPSIDDRASTINDMLDYLGKSIKNGDQLRICYQTSPNMTQSIYIMPLKIVYDSAENQYALLSAEQNQVMIYLLDHIMSVKRVHRKTADIDSSLLSRAPYVWGLDFNAAPEHVKVRFYHEANVWNKVRRDLSYRQGKLYEKDGYLYYEDTVYGIDKFKSWIAGYGSSAIVLEPESLRQQIIDSLKKRKGRF